MNEKYFTLVVTLCNDEILQYKNLTDIQIKDLQKVIWIQGIKKTINHTTVELLSPFLIRKAIIVEQSYFDNG